MVVEESKDPVVTVEVEVSHTHTWDIRFCIIEVYLIKRRGEMERICTKLLCFVSVGEP